MKWTSKSKTAQVGKAAIVNKVFCKPSWQSRSNHYVHYSDIQLNSKESIGLLQSSSSSNGTIMHKELLESLNEWKFHYILSQVNNLVSYSACNFLEIVQNK